MTSTAHHKSLVSLFIVTLFAGGCGQSRLGVASQPAIVGGKIVEAADLPVVALIKRDSQGIWYPYCTGVLVAARFVLTAAHCSMDIASKTPYAPAGVFVVQGETQPEREGAQRWPVAAIIPYPNFAPGQLARVSDAIAAEPSSAGDLAVWQLQEPHEGAPLASILSPERIPAVFQDGQKILIMGFGVETQWDSPWSKRTLHEAETPYRVNVAINARVKTTENGRTITHTVTQTFNGRSDSEFYAGGNNQPDTCKGDSGGPAFVKLQDGTLALVGVTSRGSVSCNVGGVYTLVPSYAAWISQNSTITLL